MQNRTWNKLYQYTRGLLSTNLIPLLLVLTFSILVRLPQINAAPCTDSASYYRALHNACNSFELSAGYIRWNFNLVGHPTYGYALLCAIPELINPGDYRNIWIAHTIMAIVAIYCVYDLLHRIRGVSDVRAALGAALFGCSPMFLGLNTYMEPDFGCAVFMIYLIWSYHRRKYMTMFITAVLLVLSKEFGVGLLVGFYLGAVIYIVCHGSEEGIIRRVVRMGYDRRNLILFILSVCGGFGAIFLTFGPGSWANRHMNNGGGVAQIGIDIHYMAYRMVQFVSTDLVWMQLLVIVGLVVARRISSHTDRYDHESNIVITGCVGAIMLYEALLTITVTYTLPRYNLPAYLLLTLIMVVLIVQIPVRLATTIAEVILGGMMLLQAYVTIDPVMLHLYPRVAYSNAPLVYSNYLDNDWIGDYAVYNYQYTYWQQAIAEVIQDIDITDDMNVLVWNGDRWALPGNYGNNIYWDNASRHWTAIQQDECYALNPVLIDKSGNRDESEDLLETAVFIEPRRSQNDAEGYMSTYYMNVESGEVSTLYGRLVYYTGELK